MPSKQKALLAATGEALSTAEIYLAAARARLFAQVAPDGRLALDRLANEQIAAHSFAWMASYVTALRQLRVWAVRLDEAGLLGEIDALILEIVFGEYLAQLAGGVPMAQAEFARPQDLGLGESDIAPLRAGAAGALAAETVAARLRLGARLAETGEGALGNIGIDDADLDMIRDQVRRFAEREVAPNAQDWHRQDRLIPLPIVEELGAIGVFGMTIPDRYGGLGLGKLAMSVVSEELSRAYLGVGSLGTRSEIAGELIRLNGTEAQKVRWLPQIASGKVLPTAVFTEPNTGSDLASLQTRAVRDGAVYRVYGAKTWITHGARSDLMTLLARTDPAERGYQGLSMFLAKKPRGSEEDPFP
ncbi:MAG: acyl-CoA dehydrogenase family protein, partial [Stellaceae bacterium]